MKAQTLICIIVAITFVLVALLFLYIQASSARPRIIPEQNEFHEIDAISENLITTLKINPINPNMIYAGTDRFLYLSQDNGVNWQVVTSVKAYINCIYYDKSNNIYAGTDKGLFCKISSAEHWGLIYSGKEGKGENVLAIGEAGNRILIGTQSGLYDSADFGKTWRNVTSLGSLQVSALSEPIDRVIYAANESGLYKSDVLLNSWEKIYYIRNLDADETEEDESDTSSDLINSIISSSNRQALYFATKKGVFHSDAKAESWQRLPRQGLLSRAINKLILSSDNELFAATANGLFKLNFKNNIWEKIYKGLDNDSINDIAINQSNGDVFVATSHGLFKSSIKSLADSNQKLRVLLKNFADEPTILEVQNQAIEYAEVHPEKINNWRRKVSKKALMPKLTLDADRYVTDLYHWDAGQTPDAILKGDDTVSWGVSLSWDFGDLIWNSDQTAIDTRSRLMVQLRQDILDEVNRLYFERRRLQITLLKSPPEDELKKIEKELRIEELTADLDALTGGYFSREKTAKASRLNS
ncbi:MAG: hypothetical protein KJ593_08055 [Candidatus Omnitrophica bacterium]|nr:hypothetical protein [Candidatus Omnitrophota bacterium]